MARFYGCITLLVLGVIALSAARADEASDSLYPGRYVTNCKPAPILGCVCDTDAGQAARPSRSTSGANDHAQHIRDTEYVRMIERMRLTCNAVTQSEGLR